MKKFLTITIGIILGATAAVVSIGHQSETIAYGADGVWSFNTSYDWKDSFNNEDHGTNLYALVYNKLIIYPEEKSLSQISQNTGLSEKEVKMFVEGDITALLEQEKDTLNLSTEEAFVKANELKEQYDLFFEIYELQSELEVDVGSTEIFANGNLEDSGFDLVYDLSVMEKILFEEESPITIGHTYSDSIPSPYLIEEGSSTDSNGTSSGIVTSDTETGDVNLEVLAYGVGGASSGSSVTLPQNSGATAILGNSAILNIGEKEIDAKILDYDICLPEGDFGSAIVNFEDQNDASGGGNNGTSDNGTSDQSGQNGGGTQGTGTVGDSTPVFTSKNDLKPAPADDWRKTWCADWETSEEVPDLLHYFGTAGFESLGGVTNDVLATKLAIDQKKAGSIALRAGVCFDYYEEQATYSTYTPEQKCITCELEQINSSFEDLFTQSLVPNKVTGQFLESTKCKEANDQTQFDMKFITLPSPVPTPQNDDLVYRTNIFDEWKQFVDKYKPLLEEEKSLEQGLKYRLSVLPENMSQADLLEETSQEMERLKTESLEDMQNIGVVNDGANTKLYAQTIGAELKQMTGFFESYKETFSKMLDTCNEITAKPYIQ